MFTKWLSIHSYLLEMLQFPSPFLLVSESVCNIRISKEILHETPGKTLVVSCKDYAGQPVVWKGPKGLLGPRTRPRVEDRSVGKLLVFNDTKIEDSGEYFCSTLRKDETKKFTLRIEGKVRPLFLEIL